MKKITWVKMKWKSTLWSDKAVVEFFDDNYKYLYDTLLGEMDREKPVWLCVKNNEPTRSTAQNNLYWVYLTLIEKETGDRKETQHERYKQMFLTPSKEKMSDGYIVNIYPTTTELTTKEFSDYIREIESFTGILVPPLYTHEL